MGSDLQVGKVQFTKLMDIIKPVVMSQFIAWLDEKVAEFKVQGYMNLDTGTEAPKWIKDYSMSILVSGISFQSNEQHGRAADKSQHSKSQHSDNLHRPRDSDSVTSTRTTHRLSDVHHRTSERGSIMGSNVNNLSVSRKRSPECIIDDDDDDDDVVEVKRERVDGQELDSCSISESRDILSSLATEQNSPASIRRIPASPVLPLTTEAFPVHSRLSEVSVSTPDRTFSSIRSSPHKPMKDLPTIPSHSSSSPSAIPPTLAGATGTIPSRSPSRTLVQRSQLDSRTTISQASDLDMSVEDISVVLDDNGDAVVEHSRILKKEPDQILQETDSRSSAGDFDPGPSTSQDDMALALVNPLSNPDNDDSIDDRALVRVKAEDDTDDEDISILGMTEASFELVPVASFEGSRRTRTAIHSAIQSEMGHGRQSADSSVWMQDTSQQASLATYHTLPQFSDRVQFALDSGNIETEYDKLVEECAFHLLTVEDIKDRFSYAEFGKMMYEQYPCIAIEQFPGREPWFQFIKKLSRKVRNTRHRRKLATGRYQRKLAEVQEFFNYASTDYS